MIRIKKPKKAPAILQNQGATATRVLCQDHDANAEAYKRWHFKKDIYGDVSVKKSLQKAQNNKCAFCESQIAHIAHGDVEHFRPKAGFRQNRKDPLVKPGYYWLVYEWANLLFCCQICNQTFKGNHCPLADERKRARSHHDEISVEQPLLIHPAADDPQEFLEFNEEFLTSVGGNQRGNVTIEVLGLNREPMAEKRRDVLTKIRLLMESRDQFRLEVAHHPNAEKSELIGKITRHLSQCLSDSGEYAAMLRAIARNSAGSTQ